MDNNELMHFGTKGMKWGVRRYQNPDGSLTKAGKRKYGTKTNFEKVQAVKRAGEKKNSKSTVNRAKANERTENEINKLKKKYGLEDSKKDIDSSIGTEAQKPKSKTLSEMTDDELRNKILRTRLENEYKSLHPEHVSKGEKFMKTVGNDVIVPAAKNIGRQYLEKVLKEKAGLNSKDSIEGLKKEVEKLRLEKERKDLKNPKKDPYKEMQEAIKNHSTKKAYDKIQKEMQEEQSGRQTQRQEQPNEKTNKTETYSGTVEGDGSSRRSTGEQWTKRSSTDDIFDTDWRNVTDETTSYGRDFVSNRFLLEDKNR